MAASTGVNENFRFMVLEVTKQLEKTARVMEKPAPGAVSRILSNDNYIDILKSIIEKKCISFFRHTPRLDKQSADMVSAISVVTNNLERIGDMCGKVAAHLRDLQDATFMARFDYGAYFDEILPALRGVADALLAKDTAKALSLARTEAELNRLYDRDYERIKGELRLGEHTDDLLTGLYVFHSLERIGDALLNVGEAILFAATGEKLKIHEYVALDEALRASGAGSALGECSIEVKWETRSGHRIGKVAGAPQAEGDVEAIFKEGNQEKLLREEANIERWEAVIPGLPPRVLEYRHADGDAALLLEFLDGLTMQDLIFGGDAGMIDRALTLTEQALDRAWTATKQPEPTHAGFLEQLSARIEDVLRVHPGFEVTSGQVGALAVGSLEELLAEARRIEPAISAPFSVLVHGDFNTDNVIYDQLGDRIHFIDLHRSRQMDYVQDVSVFLVSNFRMPVFEENLRERLNDISIRFYHFARDFADRNEDRTFEARLALGLARSFITSTRFELNEDFAKVMHLRSVYLLEKIIEHAGRPWDSFRLTLETFRY